MLIFLEVLSLKISIFLPQGHGLKAEDLTC